MHSILTDLDSTLLAMAAIEDRRGDSWLQRQLAAVEKLKDVDLTLDPDEHPKALKNSVGYTIGQALTEIGSRKQPDWASDEDWSEMQRAIVCIVYGDGGWNRWGVRYTGEVIFSRYHTRRGDLEKVEAAGFGTW